VVLSEVPGAPEQRRLQARAEGILLCDPKRFATRVEVVDSMTSNVVSTVVASLEDGVFAGTHIGATADFTRGQCEITIWIPTRPR
jgi:hypothetical protein